MEAKAEFKLTETIFTVLPHRELIHFRADMNKLL